MFNVFFRFSLWHLLFCFFVPLSIPFPRLSLLNCFWLSAQQLLHLLTVTASVVWWLNWRLILQRITAFILTLVFLVTFFRILAHSIIQILDVLLSTSILNNNFLPTRSICLIHLMLNLSHSFSLFDSKLFALLIPAPFVNLSFAKTNLNTNLGKLFL